MVLQLICWEDVEERRASHHRSGERIRQVEGNDDDRVYVLKAKQDLEELGLPD
jgi:hypothetical protein